MSIRIRVIEGKMVAICAARSVARPGDRYLDDAEHSALADKFARDFNAEGWSRQGKEIPFDESRTKAVLAEEDNNPNREWWDSQYGDPFNERGAEKQ